MRKWIVALILLLTGAFAATAAPGGAVRCGKLLDVRSGQLLTDQVVTFDENGVISSVAPASPASPSATDLSEATCLPGLIDVHTHITDELAQIRKREVCDEGRSSGPQRLRKINLA